MKNSVLAAAFFVAALVAMASPAGAQQKDCECVNGIKCVWVNGVLECDPSITCSGSFNLTTPQPAPNAPLDVDATPTDINATAFIPSVGNITITLDATRQPDPTTIESNDPNLRYPATVTINFYADATVGEGRGGLGTTYTSLQQVTYKNSNAHSFDPFDGTEEFVLDHDVDFVLKPASGGPVVGGEVAFTLRAGDSKFTLGPGRPH